MEVNLISRVESHLDDLSKLTQSSSEQKLAGTYAKPGTTTQQSHAVHEERKNFAPKRLDLAPPKHEEEICSTTIRPGVRYDYQYGLTECVLRSAVKGFLFMYTGQIFVNVIPLLLRRSSVMLFDGLLRFSDNNFRSRLLAACLDVRARYRGCSFAAFLAIFNGVMYLGRGEGGSFTSYRGFYAGAASALSLFLLPPKTRVAISLFTFVRAIEIAVNMAVEQRKGKWKFPGSVFVTMLCNAHLAWAFTKHPQTLPDGHLHFMESALCQSQPVYNILRDVIHGRPLTLPEVNRFLRLREVKPVLDPLLCVKDVSKAVPLLFDGVESPIQIVPRIFAKGHLQALHVYFPVYLFPFLIFNLQKMLRQPRHSLHVISLSAARSSLFLSLAMSISWFTILSAFRWGSSGGAVSFISGLLSGSMLLVEKSSRRIEIALYMLAQSLRVMLAMIQKSKLIPKIPHLEVLIFAASMALIGQAYVGFPKALRPLHAFLFQKFVDGRHKHSLFTRSVRRYNSSRQPHTGSSGR